MTTWFIVIMALFTAVGVISASYAVHMKNYKSAVSIGVCFVVVLAVLFVTAKYL